MQIRCTSCGRAVTVAATGALPERCPHCEQAPVPERLGKWRIERLLAAGGMGEVYVARHVLRAVTEQGARYGERDIGRGGVVPVAFMSEATAEACSALHIERTLGGGAAEGALGPAMLGLTMAIGRFSGQVVAERLREVTVVTWPPIMAATGAVIPAPAPTPLIGYIGLGTLGLGVSVIGPMGLALVGRLVPAHFRTEAISRAAVIGFSGFFFAPSLMGFTSETFGLRVAFGCVAGLLLLAVPVALVAARIERE